jgi:hypothetical protein
MWCFVWSDNGLICSDNSLSSTHPPRALSVDHALYIDQVELPNKPLEWLSTQWFRESVGLHGGGRGPFDVDLSILNLLSQPVLMYVDVTQFSGQKRLVLA